MHIYKIKATIKIRKDWFFYTTFNEEDIFAIEESELSKKDFVLKAYKWLIDTMQWKWIVKNLQVREIIY